MVKMIGLDTNVLVRFLVGDDKRQCDYAMRVIDDAGKAEAGCFISIIVFCELVWVLESAYGYRRHEIADVLERLLSARQFIVDEKDAVYHAVKDYRQGKADFSDYLIGRMNRSAGCDVTVTFDKTLKNNSHFRLLGQ